MQSGKSVLKIAQEIGRSKSTIYRELHRNKGKKDCRHKQAHAKACEMQTGKVKTRIPHEIWILVRKYLKQDHSPEQISGELALQGIPVSTERVYQYILADKKTGGSLHRYLRCQRVKKRRYGKPDKRGQIKNRRSIDERSSIVDERTRVGDWEVDVVEGSKGGNVFVTLAERKTRVYLFEKVENKSARAVTQGILNLLTPLKEYVHTLTFDNGKEFAYHMEIGKQLEADTYFAHPYHLWERGLNENSNGLLRQYFPKGKSLEAVTRDDVVNAMLKLNHRPRKCLDYQTPYQAFLAEANKVALST